MSVDQIKGSENGQGLRIGIVQARFNEEFGKESLESCLAELKKLGVAESDILVCSVPGALEVPLVLLQLGNSGEYDALIAIGTIIKGETYHFEVVCNESAAGVSRVSLELGIPVANAILTTFNEVNMAPVMELRKKFQDAFVKEHGVKLGFMSFFVKAAVHALKKFPVINASVDGNDIVYHGYFDIGIAVGSPRGLVVPILRNADQMSFADIEKKIAEFGQKAKDGKLGIEEMTGGTFSISNGGTFGSMMSTPIINPPQSAILGVHATKERAVVENGQIVIRPMNYLAMSYDHRIIDGREAVLGLVAMKEALEDPARLLFDI